MVFIFTDASYCPKLGLGVGGFLSLPILPTSADLPQLTEGIHFKNFHDVANTQLEVETILWALETILAGETNHAEIIVFTDCQTAATLLTRRSKLEAKGYLSSRSGKLHRNADLYQRFFRHYDRWGFRISWLKGHMKESAMSLENEVFSCLDKAVRKRLKEIRLQWAE